MSDIITKIMHHYRDMKSCKPTHHHHHHNQRPQNLLKLKENVCDVVWRLVVVVVVVTSSDLPGA